MYDPDLTGELPLSQGDIVDNVVLAYVPDISNPVFVLDGEYVERRLDRPLDEELTLVAQALKSAVLVIEPNCSIDHDDFISVARVLAFDDSAYNRIPPTRPPKRARHIVTNYQRVGVQPSVYYLQEAPHVGFPKSVASFLEIHTIFRTPENIEYLQTKRILRLNKEAVGDLQYRIGFFFGRYSVTKDNYMLTEQEALDLHPQDSAQADTATD